VFRDKEVSMRFPSQMSDPSFNVLASTRTFTKKYASGGSNVGGLEREIAETNRRLDGVARNQNASPDQVRKLDDLRRQFNERMTKITEGTTDRAKQQEEYRAARRDLSEQLTNLFGGPRAG
jgi:chromosome segregation ATPase